MILNRLKVLFLFGCLLLGSVSAAYAQYSIPDCAVARVNEITNQVGGEGWMAGRDQFYQQLSVEWNAETAGLSAEQLAAYTQVYCQSLVISDGGIEQTPEGEVWNLSWSYIPVSQWLAQGGGSSSNSGGATTGSTGGATTGNTSGATTSSGGLSGTGNTGGATVNTGAQTGGKGDTSDGATVSQPAQPLSATEVFFETDFSTLPDELALYDQAEEALEGDIVESDGDSVLRIKAEGYQYLYFTDNSLTDYALEVDLTLHSGIVVLTARSGDGFCAGYDFGVNPAEDFGYLQATDENCDTVTLDNAVNLGLAYGEPFTLRIEAIGSEISASVNGEVVMAGTDNSHTQGYPVLFIFADEDSKDEALVDISAFRVLTPGTNANTTATTTGAAETLTQYGGASANAIAELQSLGLVPAGGTLIFHEPQAYFEGDGMWFQPLATSAPHTNIVMAGELEVTFASDSEYEACTLMARVVSVNNTAVEELNVGLDSDGDIILYDRVDESEDFGMIDYTSLDGSLEDNHHILMIVMGDRMTVYVDGQRMFENLQVEERAGTYGVGLVSGSGESRCQANNIWVYSFD